MKLKNGHLWKFTLMGTHFMCLLHLCSSTWIPKGDYIASNTDECTSTLSYAVSLKKPGSVSFQYFYPDNRIGQGWSALICVRGNIITFRDPCWAEHMQWVPIKANFHKCLCFSFILIPDNSRSWLVKHFYVNVQCIQLQLSECWMAQPSTWSWILSTNTNLHILNTGAQIFHILYIYDSLTWSNLCECIQS